LCPRHSHDQGASWSEEQYDWKVDGMAERTDVRRRVEQLIERAQDEILEASNELARGITKGTERYVPPISKDVERMVDEVFDFAERVIKGQRRMVSDVVKTLNEQTDRAAEVGRATTQKATKRVAAARKAAAKRVPVKKAAAKRRPVKGTTRKTTAKKASTGKSPVRR
jgi:hypothetical protein